MPSIVISPDGRGGGSWSAGVNPALAPRLGVGLGGVVGGGHDATDGPDPLTILLLVGVTWKEFQIPPVVTAPDLRAVPNGEQELRERITPEHPEGDRCHVPGEAFLPPLRKNHEAWGKLEDGSSVPRLQVFRNLRLVGDPPVEIILSLFGIVRDVVDVLLPVLASEDRDDVVVSTTDVESASGGGGDELAAVGHDYLSGLVPVTQPFLKERLRKHHHGVC